MPHSSEYFKARYSGKCPATNSTNRFFPRSYIRVNNSEQKLNNAERMSEYLKYLVDSHDLFNNKIEPKDKLTMSILKLYMVYLISEILCILLKIRHNKILFKIYLIGLLFYLETTFLSKFSYLILLFFFYFNCIAIRIYSQNKKII
jgi:hypothetical protein